MKISILLPYKENFSPIYPGAVSLFVNDTTKISKYKKNITVFGNTNYRRIFNLKYKNIPLSKFRFSKLSKNLLFGISLFLGVGLSLNVSVSLGNFVDEYASIASINSYLKTLILDAGFLGGPYSVQLTSGAFSSFGFFIGWEFTKNIFIARTFNVIIIFLIMYIFIFKTKKLYSFNQNTNSIFLSAIFIIPWWHGSLYSLGEIFSTIIFMISIVTFRSNNKLSMFLFAISIFYGKKLID